MIMHITRDFIKPEILHKAAAECAGQLPEENQSTDTAKDEELRELRNAYYRLYYRMNKEKIKEYQKEWKKKHPEKQREYMKRWRDKNPDKVQQYQINWIRKKLLEAEEQGKTDISTED